MNNIYTLFAIAIIAFVTFGIRLMPFLLFGGKSTPKIIEYLGRVLPYSIMAMLVIYCLKSVSFSTFRGFVPAFLASGIVIISYVWKRNSLISIIFGTFFYMILYQKMV